MGANRRGFVAPQVAGKSAEGRGQDKKMPARLTAWRAFFLSSAHQDDINSALTSFACSSAWYEERTNGPEATFLKPIL
jgi:hypothetical protein